jgi:hypothetical protein
VNLELRRVGDRTNYTPVVADAGIATAVTGRWGAFPPDIRYTTRMYSWSTYACLTRGLEPSQRSFDANSFTADS